MRLLKRIFTIIMLIIAILVSTSFAKSGVVIVEATRIREKPTTNSKIVSVIYEDDEVEILEEESDWYKIQYNENSGYVKKEFIKTKSSSNDTNSTTTKNTANVNNDVLNSSNVTTNNVNNNEITNSNVENNTQTNKRSDKVIVLGETAVKLLPNFGSTDILKVNPGKEITVLAELNNWVQVTDGSVTGWMLKNKIQDNISNVTENSTKPTENEVINTAENVQNTVVDTAGQTVDNNVNTNIVQNNTETSNENSIGTINVETAKIREKATTSSTALEYLDYGEKVTIIGEEDDWYKVKYKELIGYIKKSLINVEKEKDISSRSIPEGRLQERPDNTTISLEEINNINNALSKNKGKEVVDYALQYLGYPYVVGGKTPESGFDCSGFTRYVYLNFGVQLGTTAAYQNDVGEEIDRSELIPGDLILFYDEGMSRIGHTGIYIGNNEFIHSANPERGIVIDNLNTNTYYDKRFITARRIVED